MRNLISYIQENYQKIFELTIEHIGLTVFAVLIAMVIGIPLGIVITKNKKLANGVLGTSGVIQATPSLALLGFLIPFLGIGEVPAIIMVILYSLLPIIKNTYVGLSGVDPNLIEASKGMGMTDRQILFRIKLPIAYPLIMAGLRISVVSAVGLMTLAAFIGAGGLGYLVYSGVQTVNNAMILSGAIPAMILALLLDYLVGKTEDVLTPYGIQVSMNKENLKPLNKIKKQRKVLLGLFAAVVMAFIVSTSVTSFKERNTIVIGSKNFSENATLAYMMEDIIEYETNLDVKVKDRMGATSILHEALVKGDIDIYADYTGTGYMSLMKREVEAGCDADCVYEEVKTYYHDQFDVTWLEPFGFNNTYTLAITKEMQENYQIKTYSDLASLSQNFVLGSTFEFLNRNDGYLGLQEAYPFHFGGTESLDEGLRYRAMESGDIDVTDAFSTDGLLIKHNLFVLEDDLGFFPPYYAAPLVRGELIEKHPEVQTAVLKLALILDDETMSELNYKVDVEKMSSQDVAYNFLIEQGLIN
jgi:glycine betaine/choline ABC-type transport system substrate-binding protein/ABC-type proline/glycine betaine transport system permease subunit